MQCIQIKPFLSNYGSRELPAYKAAWVAQHLAGCDGCRALLASASPAGPLATTASATGAAASVSPGLVAEGAASVAVQRSVPPALRHLTSALALLTVLGAGWLVSYANIFQTGRPAPALAPVRAAGPSKATEQILAPQEPGIQVRIGSPLGRETGESVRFESGVQSQGGVSLWIESVRAVPEELLVKVRFHGKDLYPPAGLDSWLTVMGARGQTVESRVQLVTVDSRGVGAELSFQLPVEENSFRLLFTGVNQILPVRWNLALPDPPETWKRSSQPVNGLPDGVVLDGYGPVGDLLQVELRTTSRQGPPIPRLYLRDAKGTSFAPSSRTGAPGEKQTTLQYAIPRELHLPIRLVGDGYLRKYLGPWTIGVTMLK